MRAYVITFALLPAQLVLAAHRGVGGVTWEGLLQAKSLWQAETGAVSIRDGLLRGRNVTIRVAAPAVRTGVLFWCERADGTVDPNGEVWRGPVWDSRHRGNRTSDPALHSATCLALERAGTRGATFHAL